jgi:hypothetical protein
MKRLFFFILLVSVVIAAGCVGGSRPAAATPPPTTVPVTAEAVVTTAPVTSVPTPFVQTYKTADLGLTLNTLPAYGFRMDYPSEWTYQQEHTRDWKAGFNFSSPDQTSNVYVYLDDGAGNGYYFYPLDLPTENQKKTWAGTVITKMTQCYTNDGAGNPMDCAPTTRSSAYYHRRVLSNDPVLLPANLPARKLVFAPDAKDTSTNWNTVYLMHVGNMQGYNFTVPDHYEIGVKVNGPVWDYGMGGQGFAIWQSTPQGQVKSDKGIYDHMVASFEVTGG